MGSNEGSPQRDMDENMTELKSEFKSEFSICGYANIRNLDFQTIYFKYLKENSR